MLALFAGGGGSGGYRFVVWQLWDLCGMDLALAFMDEKICWPRKIGWTCDNCIHHQLNIDSTMQQYNGYTVGT